MILLSIFYRLTNILQKQTEQNIEVDKIWKVVKKIKSGTPLNIKCDYDGLYEEEEDRQSQVEALERYFRMNPSKVVLGNITDEVLKLSAEMYIYLNICPGTLGSWFLFYQDLFQTQTLNKIILTLNRLTKVATEKEYFKSLAQNLFKKAATIIHNNMTFQTDRVNWKKEGLTDFKFYFYFDIYIDPMKSR